MEQVDSVKRRLIDIQYFYETNQVVFHEVIDGKREYSYLNNPELVYGIRKACSGKPEPSDFFLEKDKIDIKRCSFINRYREIAEELGYDTSQLKGISSEHYKDFKRSLMSDPRLYFADNSITFQEKVNYFNRHEDEIDYSMPMKVMSFDIEVHDDYSPEVYEAIMAVSRCHNNALDSDALNKIEKAINTESISGIVAKLMTVHTEEDPRNISYKTLLAKIYGEEKQSDRDHLITMLAEKAYSDQYEAKMGFPEEEYANNRVDAISAFDNVENIMYLSILMLDEDMKDEYSNWSKTDEGVAGMVTRIEDYLNMVNLRVYMGANKKINTEYPELMDEYIEATKGVHDREGMSSYERVLDKVREVLGDKVVEDIMNIKVVLKMFNDEYSLLADFFKSVRFDIQPNFILAHNHKFDFLTLYNRIKNHYGLVPELYFNQIGPFFTDEHIDPEQKLMEISIRIDYNSANNKQNKTFIKVPGIVWLDSMLLAAKMTNGERDFSLDALSRDILKESKFKFKGVIQQLYLTNLEHFLIYSAVDTLLVHMLNNSMGLVENFESTINGSYSTWSEHSLKSVYITNSYKYSIFKEFGMMTRVNLNNSVIRLENEKSLIADEDEDSDEENESKRGGPGFKGAYVTNLREVNTYGLHEGMYDVDASTFYPRVITEYNAMSDKLLGQWRDLDFYQEALITPKMNFGARYLGTDRPEVIYNSL